MFWIRFQASFIGRRRALWVAGGVAVFALAVLLLLGLVSPALIPAALLPSLLFGALQGGSAFLSVSRWSGLDYVPGRCLGALVGAAFGLVWWGMDVDGATFAAMLGSFIGFALWVCLPIVPNGTPDHLRALVGAMVAKAHATGAPLTQVTFHPYMTNRDDLFLALAAKGPLTFTEEPRWWSVRAAFSKPTLLPVRFTEELDAAFPDGVLWTVPASAHAQLAHAGRVAASEAASVFNDPAFL